MYTITKSTIILRSFNQAFLKVVQLYNEQNKSDLLNWAVFAMTCSKKGMEVNNYKVQQDNEMPHKVINLTTRNLLHATLYSS